MPRKLSWESVLCYSMRLTEGCVLKTQDSKESRHQAILTSLWSPRVAEVNNVENTLLYQDQNVKEMGPFGKYDCFRLEGKGGGLLELSKRKGTCIKLKNCDFDKQ